MKKRKLGLHKKVSAIFTGVPIQGKDDVPQSPDAPLKHPYYVAPEPPVTEHTTPAVTEPKQSIAAPSPPQSAPIEQPVEHEIEPEMEHGHEIEHDHEIEREIECDHEMEHDILNENKRLADENQRELMLRGAKAFDFLGDTVADRNGERVPSVGPELRPRDGGRVRDPG